MSELPDPTLLLFAGGVPLYLIFYVFARYSYTIDSEHLVARWKILHFVPFNRRRISLASIVAVQPFRFPRDLLSLAAPFGRPFSPNGALLEYQGMRRRRIYISPPNLNEFRIQLRAAGVEL